jgi:hypothetical protein
MTQTTMPAFDVGAEQHNLNRGLTFSRPCREICTNMPERTYVLFNPFSQYERFLLCPPAPCHKGKPRRILHLNTGQNGAVGYTTRPSYSLRTNCILDGYN